MFAGLARIAASQVEGRAVNKQANGSKLQRALTSQSAIVLYLTGADE